MRGFTDRGLVLLSAAEDYYACGAAYKYDYKLAVSNVIHYMRSVGIAHDCFITDSLATGINMQDPTWLATGAQEDVFFMQNFAGVPKYELKPAEQELVSTIRAKFPIERGLEQSERLKIVAKRVQYVERSIISSYRFIVVFGKYFNVKSIEGDGRAVLRVNEKKFYTTLMLSGKEVPINSFLQIPHASLCLSNWGMYSE
jgi:hypothetical protein